MKPFCLPVICSALVLIATAIPEFSSAQSHDDGEEHAPYQMTIPGDAPKIHDRTVFENDLLRHINRIRSEHGRQPLRRMPRLDLLAHMHSRDMDKANNLSHDGMQERSRLAGAPHCVENVTWNSPNPEITAQGWLESPGHRKNLLDRDITHVGLGRYNEYDTMFGCKYEGPPAFHKQSN